VGKKGAGWQSHDLRIKFGSWVFLDKGPLDLNEMALITAGLRVEIYHTQKDAGSTIDKPVLFI